MNNKSTVSIFRTGAIKLLTLFAITISVYLKFFFDSHVGKLISYSIEKVNGAQVDVIQFKSNFFQPSLSITKIEITNNSKPQENIVEIHGVNINLIGDALLRGKFVIENVNLRDVTLHSPRKTPGKVYQKNESSILSNIQNFSKSELNKFEKKNSDNSLGIIISLLNGKETAVIGESIRDGLVAEKKLNQLENNFSQKKESWKLSKQTIEEKIQKYNNYKFEKNLDKLIKQIKEVKKDYKTTNSEISSFKTDISSFRQEFQEVKKAVEHDKNKLSTLAQIPELDIKDQISQLLISFLKEQYAPYLNSIESIRKKIPTQVTEALEVKLKSNNKLKEDDLTKERLRQNKVFTFPIKGGYPLFWLKKLEININKKNNFQLFTNLIHLSTSPSIIDNYPEAEFDLRGENLSFKRFTAKGKLTPDNQLKIDGSVGPFISPKLSIISTKDFSWQLAQAKDQTNFNGMFGIDVFELKVHKTLNNFSSHIQANSSNVEKILIPAFKQVTPVDLNVLISGSYDSPKINLKSETPKLISKNIEKEIKGQLNEKIKNKQKQAIDKLQKKISTLEQNYNELKNKFTQNLKLRNFDFEKMKKDLLKDNLKNVDIKKTLKKIDLKKLF